ncbi:MAG: M48 family metallopeptidase [Melioribacteraceae bacterium]|nr:M48 family metallopeptidase [Melioribacteraceae bacterium]
MNSKKYNNIKLGISILESLISFILLFLFVFLGCSQNLEAIIREYSDNDYLVFLLFTIITGTGFSIIFFPLNFYSSYILEHKYNLSNQTIFKWAWENIKGVLVGGIIGLPILLLFLYAIKSYDNLWWLPFAIMMFIISVVLAQVVPILILPIFYKITPLDIDELKDRILELAKDAGMKIENVFKFDMSKNTKKANAAFTGLGKTKRIILGDTLLENFTNDEIETVLAHEFGHYKHKHITKNLVISTLSSFLTFYLMALLFSVSIGWFGFTSIDTIAALPILALWAMLIGLIQTPLSNILSRKFEYEADEYAVKITKKKDVFINTLEKLTDQNLGDKEPHSLVECFFYSHPSINNRKAKLLSVQIDE